MIKVDLRSLKLESPVGELLLTSDGSHLTGLYFAPHHEGSEGTGPDRILERAANQLRAYFAGDGRAFDIPLRFEGTPFQTRVWQLLQAIPYGETVSYATLAKRAGAPNGARAAGGAVGSNPISIIIPCHRVIGSNGRLTGFGGGIPRKQWLLEHEKAIAGLPFSSEWGDAYRDAVASR
jgi:methylated-DNA-[protein]-cysteine S-methyltransferase